MILAIVIAAGRSSCDSIAEPIGVCSASMRRYYYARVYNKEQVCVGCWILAAECMSVNGMGMAADMQAILAPHGLMDKTVRCDLNASGVDIIAMG